MFSLKQMFGKVVKVTRDVSAPKENPSEWYEEIQGKRGLIYPQSLDNNTVCVQTTKRLAKQMLSLFKDKAVEKRHGDDEYEFIIPVDLVKSTFRYIKPKKRRVLSESQKQACRDRLNAYKFNLTTHVSDSSKA